VPGQVFYDAPRRAILVGADGIVFVADSQEARLAANFESIRNLEKNLRGHGCDIAAVPYVLQLNKRDLPSAMPAGEMARLLNIKGEPTLEATATTGAGVFDTLKAIAREVLLDLRRRRPA
jgi:signal recognition particle receptor subunit beta